MPVFFVVDYSLKICYHYHNDFLIVES
jgi:hypothetical protein